MLEWETCGVFRFKGCPICVVRTREIVCKMICWGGPDGIEA